MPDVQKTNRTQYVSDPANLLSEGVKAEVNDRLARLRAQTSVECVVALPPEIGDVEPVEWCEELFTLWGIGKSDKDNGVLLMISPGSRKAFLMTGYGVEGALPDVDCNNILNVYVYPAMRQDNLAKAVNDATSQISTILQDPTLAEELKSAQSDNYAGSLKTLDSSVIWNFVYGVAAVIFIISICVFIHDCVAARKCKSNYTKAELWRAHLPTFFWLGVLSCGAGLIFFLLAWAIYRRWRMRPLKCSTCGAKMKRLPEDKDNELLSDAQDFEEKIQSVDYDVWECPSCGTIERFPYRANQKKYTECPQCHTVAMCLECDMTVRPSTVATEGQGVKVYECQYCHYRNDKPYRIPKKEDPSSAIAAAAILGSALGRGGRGGFGGGSMGGGFGGGRTGGGGAGGSW